MRQNQSRTILIFLITPTTTWLFASFPYTTGTQKAAKISNKNSFFNWVHSLHTELMNASHSTNLFKNSCDHISTNGKAPHNSSIRSDEGLTLETSAFLTFHCGNSTFMTSFDKTKFLFKLSTGLLVQTAGQKAYLDCSIKGKSFIFWEWI